MDDEGLKSAVRLTIFILGALVVATGLTFGSMKFGSYLFNMDERTDAEIARDAFIDSCAASKFGNRYGVPNVSEKPWSCVIPLEEAK